MKKSGQRSTFPLLESIGVWNGEMPYLNEHQKRINATFANTFPTAEPHQLKNILNKHSSPPGQFKLRFLYNSEHYKIESKPYQRALIKSLQVIEDEGIDYSWKYTNRNQLNALYQKRGEHDDILIFKKGLLTDAYYSNVVVIVRDQFITPATPLLKGTMREHLLNRGMIKPDDVNINDLKESRGVLLINALNPIQTAPFVSSCNIHY